MFHTEMLEDIFYKDVAKDKFAAQEREDLMKALRAYGMIACNGKRLEDASLNELRVWEAQRTRQEVWGLEEWWNERGLS